MSTGRKVHPQVVGIFEDNERQLVEGLRPEEVQAVAGAISDFGKPPRRAELAAAVLNHFEDVYALLETMMR